MIQTIIKIHFKLSKCYEITKWILLLYFIIIELRSFLQRVTIFTIIPMIEILNDQFNLIVFLFFFITMRIKWYCFIPDCNYRHVTNNSLNLLVNYINAGRKQTTDWLHAGPTSTITVIYLLPLRNTELHCCPKTIKDTSASHTVALWLPHTHTHTHTVIIKISISYEPVGWERQTSWGAANLTFSIYWQKETPRIKYETLIKYMNNLISSSSLFHHHLAGYQLKEADTSPPSLLTSSPPPPPPPPHFLPVSRTEES